MFDLSNLEYLDFFEDIVDKLETTTQSNERHLFRVMLAYYCGKVTSSMGVTVNGWYNPLPCNIYSICLAESGVGKGFTVNAVEDRILDKFRSVFIEDTFIGALNDGINDIALHRAGKRNTDEVAESRKLWKESDTIGPYQFEFNERTTAPAVGQLRHKLLLAQAGALNLQVDEIGDNITKMTDMISVMLELYDTGRIKDGMTKNSAESKRFEYVSGFTPANLLLFGSHSSLLNGTEREHLFFNMLQAGYARRSFFAYSEGANKVFKQTPEEAVKAMFKSTFSDDYAALSNHFEKLAHVKNLGKRIHIQEEEATYLMRYRYMCEDRAQLFKSYEVVLATEMRHRYFKALKLAAATTFITGGTKITRKHLDAAIKLAEASGEDLEKILTPKKDFMRLANYLVEKNAPVTVADIEAELPCYTGAQAKKNDMMAAAIAYGYRNNILITRSFIDDIMFVKAKALMETNLDQLIISVSADIATGYEPMVIPFEDLEDLSMEDRMNWCNHHFIDGHRHMDDLIEGFNVIVLDIDDGTPMEAVMRLFEGYYAMYYMTKSSTPDFNRFRVVLPISHVLKLEREDYLEFMGNFLEALPLEIEIDQSSKQPEKKWLTNDCAEDEFALVSEYNGEPARLFDALPFIPRSSKNDTYVQNRKQFKDMNAMEYWMITNTYEGKRNTMMHRYAMVMVDMGYSEAEVREGLLSISSKMKDGLSEKEIDGSIMKTVRKKIH